MGMAARGAMLGILLLGGCFRSSSTGDRCDATKACFVVDPLGCCSGEVEVSICAECPRGMIERTSCRTSGCTACDRPELSCRLDMGGGCCGDAVYFDACTTDRCPAGYVPETECSADFPEECGCLGRRILPPEEPPQPMVPCFDDLGGCCGDYVTEAVNGCCPMGTLPESACGFGMDREPPGECRENLGGGCCGAVVEPNECGGCPEGAVYEVECAAISDDGGFFPAPVCFIQGEAEDGSCFCEEVSANACGECPPGSNSACFCEGG